MSVAVALFVQMMEYCETRLQSFCVSVCGIVFDCDCVDACGSEEVIK